MTQTYKEIAESERSTVLASYEPPLRVRSARQSEAQLEETFIAQLCAQGYEYLTIGSEADMVANLRAQLERLNGIRFTEDEWKSFFAGCIARRSDGIREKAKRIQRDHVQTLRRDDGSDVNVYLLDKKNLQNNSLQVINQYEESGGAHASRYDVTILVNGLPMVHVELKRRGVDLREAFNQINRYRRDSFWAGSGLFEYVQLFVISNGTYTKYYSNTTRDDCVNENLRNKKAVSSFKFTSYWADARNRTITDLEDFTRTFFARHTLLRVLTRYCIFTDAQELMAMRPYQIAAAEKILERIEISNNDKSGNYAPGTRRAGGYIWHTTGSGKTLTSFKTAQLATALPYIDKVIFVVDRRDLDYQTMKEYDHFEKGAANGSDSTKVLKEQLESDNSRIIVTTIQKLSIFVERNKNHPVFKKHVVIIFDECHRSQFGEMHDCIVHAFKRYHLFGFTGTPIFAKNAVKSGKSKAKTTPELFGGVPDENGKEVLALHTYTIVDAIRDENVLPFRIDTVRTVKSKDGVTDEQVSDVDREGALMAPQRISAITAYIIAQFDRKTKRAAGGRGFNSMFAVSSVPAAMAYYDEFKKQLAECGKKLTVATIFTYAPNEKDKHEDGSGTIDDEQPDTSKMDSQTRDFLDKVAIADYNAAFKTNFSTDGESFQNYYKDVSKRVKERAVDLLIVVNMFLTGFDAKELNTLWVDKNLKMHGLIQAFSRTNRIFNSVKSFGNIVCFRDLTQETDEALSLFGDAKAGSVVVMRTFADYFNGYTDDDGKYHAGYKDLLDELLTCFAPGELPLGEGAEKKFISLFGSLLKMRNILSAFDEFDAADPMPLGTLQDYQSTYIALREKYTKRDGEKEDISDDLVFEVELVKQLEVDIDYILELVAKYHEDNCRDEKIIVAINRAIDASIQLRSKKDLIEDFIANLNGSDVPEEWRKFVKERMERELSELIATEKLKDDKARAFVETMFRNGEFDTSGTELNEILPPMSRFGGGRIEKKRRVAEKLGVFFERYRDII